MSNSALAVGWKRFIRVNKLLKWSLSFNIIWWWQIKLVLKYVLLLDAIRIWLIKLLITVTSTSENVEETTGKRKGRTKYIFKYSSKSNKDTQGSTGEVSLNNESGYNIESRRRMYCIWCARWLLFWPFHK